jgi:hypothetical protein
MGNRFSSRDKVSLTMSGSHYTLHRPNQLVCLFLQHAIRDINFLLSTARMLCGRSRKLSKYIYYFGQFPKHLNFVKDLEHSSYPSVYCKAEPSSTYNREEFLALHCDLSIGSRPWYVFYGDAPRTSHTSVPECHVNGM